MTTHAPPELAGNDATRGTGNQGGGWGIGGDLAMAVSRIGVGFVFLWAFLDKLFGLEYSTPSGQSWLNGGSPTKGFLSHVSAGPLEHTFHTVAGKGWVDWLFMLGLLGVGVAVIAGVAMRPAAVAGVIMLAFMWAAEWPPATHRTPGLESAAGRPLHHVGGHTRARARHRVDLPPVTGREIAMELA